MEFSKYQKKSRKTAIYPDLGSNFIYPTLGLVGEVGEVAEKVKKVLRGGQTTFTPEQKEELKKELGDVLWYLVQLSTELNLDLNDIAETNITKLKSRKDRGVLHASGDNR